MWQTLRKPRWVLLTAVLLAVCVGFWQLGAWQLSVAQDDAAQEALERQRNQPTLALSEIVEPQEPFPEQGSNQSVSAEVTYLPQEQFLVPERRLEGQSGLWVVSPARVSDTDGILVIVRGFVTTPEAVPALPTGTVELQGTLAPGESPSQLGELPAAGQRGSIDLAALANERPGRWYNAFVFAQEETTLSPEAAQEDIDEGAMTRIPPPTVTGGIDWRNLGYALQWWVFAGFAVFVYGRQLWDESHERGETGPPAPDPPGPSGPGQGSVIE